MDREYILATRSNITIIDPTIDVLSTETIATCPSVVLQFENTVDNSEIDPDLFSYNATSKEFAIYSKD